ncbi:hypothetical protein, partial [Acinetobacter baumannii]|uniref:hypothetical protein n=1 Tax=Acinetobacter baumannii TaxID=470 RepID=UPI0038CD43DB
DRITDYKAPTAEEASDAKKAAKRPPIVNYPGEGFREMTKAEWAKLPADYKGVRGAAETGMQLLNCMVTKFAWALLTQYAT